MVMLTRMCIVGVVGVGVMTAGTAGAVAGTTGTAAGAAGTAAGAAGIATDGTGRDLRQTYPAYSNNQLSHAYDNNNYNYNNNNLNNNINSVNYNNNNNNNNNNNDQHLSPSSIYKGSNSIDDEQDNNYLAESSYSDSTTSVDSEFSSPALSALTLLGFLYFLNLIQNVLQNNGRQLRKRRDLLSPTLSPTLSPVLSPSEDYQDDDQFERDDRNLSFLEDFFVSLPSILGIKRESIDRNGRDEADVIGNEGGIKGFMSMVGSRINLISSIMSFLKDPSPSRVKRYITTEQEQSQPMLKSSDEGATQNNMVMNSGRLKRGIERNQLGSKIANSDDDDVDEVTYENKLHVRHKRFTDGMNVWYDQIEGKNAQGTRMHSSGISHFLGKLAHNFLSSHED